MNQQNHNHVIEQVPPDYYQKGVESNLLQRHWHLGKLSAVLDFIEDKPDKILDVGCASGWFLSKISKRFPLSKLYGVDIYDKAIEYGKKVYPSITFKVADAHSIPFKSNFFDLIICTEVLEHVDDPKKTLLELKRLLKKDGKAIIELDSGSALFSIVWYLWKLSSGRVWNDSHLHSFNVKKLEKMITESGFKITKKKTFNFRMAMVFLVANNEK